MSHEEIVFHKLLMVNGGVLMDLETPKGDLKLGLRDHVTYPFHMRIKRKGERGSPCLMPQVGLKGGERAPLRRMEKKVIEIKFDTHWIQ